jgi:hypothetical protein
MCEKYQITQMVGIVIVKMVEVRSVGGRYGGSNAPQRLGFKPGRFFIWVRPISVGSE